MSLITDQDKYIYATSTAIIGLYIYRKWRKNSHDVDESILAGATSGALVGSAVMVGSWMLPFAWPAIPALPIVWWLTR